MVSAWMCTADACLSTLSNIVINSELPVILNITEVVHRFGYVFPEVYI